MPTLSPSTALRVKEARASSLLRRPATSGAAARDFSAKGPELSVSGGSETAGLIIVAVVGIGAAMLIARKMRR